MGVRAAASLGESADRAPSGFHRCWYPLGLASELPAGQVIGRDFLGTRVVLYRDGAGKIIVQSAWLDTIRFRKGVLVASDRHLARFLKYVEGFPRAEPLAA